VILEKGALQETEVRAFFFSSAFLLTSPLPILCPLHLLSSSSSLVSTQIITNKTRAPRDQAPRTTARDLVPVTR
jgi:hypothetical protein